HKRISRFDLDSFSDWSLFFFMFSNRKHVFGMPCFLTKLSSYYLFNSIATCLPFIKTSVTATITSIIFFISHLSSRHFLL
ncbi:hypothetical protein, partial [Bacillus mycoides]|uniref:hypothetical protein n=1 Tax=Bacillus mycoides TaxID=1405 RepID=UPI003D6479B9